MTIGHSIMFVLVFVACFLVSASADGTSQKIIDRLDALEKEVNHLKQKDESNQAIIMEQSRVNAELKARVNTLEETVNQKPQSHMQGDTKGRRLVMVNDGLVAFMSKQKAHTQENLPLNSPIVFTDVDMNEGGSYNANTGEFVAPAQGIYMFSLSLLADNGPHPVVHGEIMHDGVPIARALAYAETTRHRDQGAVTVLVKLAAGDKVWVRSIDAPGATLGGEMFTTFSGYLLYPM